MKFKDDDTEELQINLTALIDVVFLLLIFFMVTTTFSKESQLRIKLPEASTNSKQQTDKDVLEIQISSAGLFSIRGPGDKKAKQLLNSSPRDLRLAIKDASRGKSDRVVVIRADRNTPHESVIRAMDAARRQGHTHITFATQQSRETGDP